MELDELIGFIVPCVLIAVCLLWPIVSKRCGKHRRRDAKPVEGERLAELQSMLHGRWNVRRNTTNEAGPSRYRPKTIKMPSYTTVVVNPSRGGKGQGQGPAGIVNYILTGVREKDYRGSMTLRESQTDEGRVEFHKNGSWFCFESDDRIIFHNKGFHGKVWDGAWERIGEYHRSTPASPEREPLPSLLGTPRSSTDPWLTPDPPSGDGDMYNMPPRKSVKFSPDPAGEEGDQPRPTKQPGSGQHDAAMVNPVSALRGGAAGRPQPLQLLSESDEAAIRAVAMQASRDPAQIRDYRAMALKHAGGTGVTEEAYRQLLTDELISQEIDAYTATTERERRRAAALEPPVADRQSAHPPAPQPHGRPESYMDSNPHLRGEYMSLDMPFTAAGQDKTGGGNVPEVDSQAMRRIKAAAAAARSKNKTDTDAVPTNPLEDTPWDLELSSRESFAENPMLMMARRGSGYNTEVSEDGDDADLPGGSRGLSEITPVPVSPSARLPELGGGEGGEGQYVIYACDYQCGYTGRHDAVVLHEARCNAGASHGGAGPPGIGPVSPLAAAVEGLSVHVKEANRVRMALEASCAVLESSGLLVPTDLQREREQATAAAAAAQTALDAANAATRTSMAYGNTNATPAYVPPPEFVFEGSGPFRSPGELRRLSQLCEPEASPGSTAVDSGGGGDNRMLRDSPLSPDCRQDDAYSDYAGSEHHEAESQAMQRISDPPESMLGGVGAGSGSGVPFWQTSRIAIESEKGLLASSPSRPADMPPPGGFLESSVPLLRRFSQV